MYVLILFIIIIFKGSTKFECWLNSVLWCPDVYKDTFKAASYSFTFFHLYLYSKYVWMKILRRWEYRFGFFDKDLSKVEITSYISFHWQIHRIFVSIYFFHIIIIFIIIIIIFLSVEFVQKWSLVSNIFFLLLYFIF